MPCTCLHSSVFSVVRLKRSKETPSPSSSECMVNDQMTQATNKGVRPPPNYPYSAILGRLRQPTGYFFFTFMLFLWPHFVSVWVSFFNSFHFSPFRFVFCVVLDPRDGHSSTARYLCLCPFVFAPFLSCHASGLFLRCPYVGPPAGHLTRHIQVVSAAVALSHPNSACALECKFAWFHVFFILCISFAKNSSFISVQNVHAVSSVSATGVCR